MSRNIFDIYASSKEVMLIEYTCTQVTASKSKGKYKL